MNPDAKLITCQHCGAELNDLNAKVSLINESLDLIAKILSDTNIEKWSPSVRTEYERMMEIMHKINKF